MNNCIHMRLTNFNCQSRKQFFLYHKPCGVCRQNQPLSVSAPSIPLSNKSFTIITLYVCSFAIYGCVHSPISYITQRFFCGSWLFEFDQPDPLHATRKFMGYMKKKKLSSSTLWSPLLIFVSSLLLASPLRLRRGISFDKRCISPIPSCLRLIFISAFAPPGFLPFNIFILPTTIVTFWFLSIPPKCDKLISSSLQQSSTIYMLRSPKGQSPLSARARHHKTTTNNFAAKSITQINRNQKVTPFRFHHQSQCEHSSLPCHSQHDFKTSYLMHFVENCRTSGKEPLRLL